MKNCYLYILFLMFMSLVGAKAFAHDIAVANVDGKTIYYVWTNNGTELSVSYRGTSHSSYSDEYSGTIVIPQSVEYGGNTYSVTSIGDVAFDKCSGLTSVTIPNSVTSIGYGAFADCDGLTSVTIGNSVTFIGESAFRDCENLNSVHISDIKAWCEIHFRSRTTSNPLYYAHHLYQNGEEIKELIIPNSVTSISRCAFEECHGLTSVTIGNSVTSIGEFAFENCSGLTSVTIGNGVTSIGSHAFSGCNSLTSVVIGNGVTFIGQDAFWNTAWYKNQPDGLVYAGKIAYEYKGDMPRNTDLSIKDGTIGIADYAFDNCSGLTSINIPNSVTSIGGSAFSRCTGLTSITIPNSVTSIGSLAFYGCSGLTSVHISDIKAWCGIIFKNYESNPLYYAHHLYLNGEEIKDLIIPNSVTSIGDYAFHDCSGLASVTIGNGVTYIGQDAFSGCNNLTSVIIGNGVTSIGSFAFGECSNLTSVIIGNGVTSIGSHAFSGCIDLTSIIVEEGNAIYDSRNNCNAIIKTEDNMLIIGCKNTIIPNSVTYIGGSAFNKCSGLTSITIPNSVTYIGEFAFSGCNNLTSATIGNSVESIGRSAFEYCSSLSSITIPNSVTYIGGGAFCKCRSLTSVTIGNGVTSIDSNTFADCSGLNTITIGNGVTSIEESAFKNCSSLTTITIPNSVLYIHRSAFSGCSSLFSIAMSNSTVFIGYDAFSGTAWYDSQPSGLVYAGNVAYCYKGNMPTNTHITIKDGTLGIAEGAFYDCGGLTSITIPNSVTFILNSAFHHTAWYDSQPNGLVYAGKVVYCYKGDMLSDTNITIKDGTLGIAGHAFRNCSCLTSISIPSSVTSIGEWAFNKCSGLDSVTIPEGVTYIGEGAFLECDLFSIISLIKDPMGISGKTSYRPTFSIDTFNNATLYVPKGTMDNYKVAEGWQDFLLIEEVEKPDDPTPGDKPTKSGSCGSNLYYSYDNATHVLTITGSGEMTDYDFGQNEAPWFSYANEIQAIELEPGITSIGNFAFYKCSDIKVIDIPVTVTSIGSSSFEECSSLTSLSLNEGLQYIGGSAFESCTGLESITLPSTVNTIMLNAFKNCRSITDVYCYAEDVPNTAEDAFDGTPTEKSTLHVPAPAIGAYRTAWPWSDFKEIVALTDVGIMEVKQSNGNDEYYDLTGRKVHHPQKGLYIRNGKKVIIM